MSFHNQLQPGSERSADILERLQFLLDELTGRLGGVGALAALEIHGRGRCYLSSGYTDLSRTSAAERGHLYQIGSQTKTLLAIAFVHLAQQGAIDLDRSVLDFVTLPIDRRITVRHLLMNQCGLGEMLYGIPSARWDPRIPMEPRDLIALALPQGQLFEPGSRFDYCNTGWVIAALVLENVSSESYPAAIASIVTGPLGLRNTAVGSTPPAERMLRGYMGSDATGGEMADMSTALSWAFGAGDGVSSVDDMLTLFTRLCAPNPIGVELRHLTSSRGMPAERPYFAMSAGIEYGLGVERQCWAGREVWGHPGSTFSYASGTWIDPAKAVTITTCVTRREFHPPTPDVDFRYPRAQLFSMVLEAGYSLAADHAAAGTVHV